jgi:predicted nucleic acid-binding protein
MGLYLDTSVLVSCYVAEEQSEAVLAKLAQYSGELIVSQLTEVEFCSALSMKVRCKNISLAQQEAVLDLFQQHLQEGHYAKAYLVEDVYQLAKQFLSNHSLKLRTLDALHLALSQYLEAELFTADVELANAAAVLKLKYPLPVI